MPDQDSGIPSEYYDETIYVIVRYPSWQSHDITLKMQGDQGGYKDGSKDNSKKEICKRYFCGGSISKRDA